MNSTSDSQIVERLLRASADLADDTQASQQVADRKLAHDLIEFGERNQSADALSLAARILAQIPLDPVNSAARKDDKKLIERLLEEAEEIGGADSAVSSVVSESGPVVAAETTYDGLQRGNSWVVRIDRGEFYRLTPNPIYETRTAARVVAVAAAEATVGITVRRVDLVRERRWANRRRVSAVWNSGIYRRELDVRVYNLSGPNNLRVRIAAG